MSRWRTWGLIGAAGFIVGLLTGYAIFVPSQYQLDLRDQEDKKEHDISLRILRPFFPPGMTRIQVEERLKTAGIPFAQSCCTAKPDVADVSDIVFAGREQSHVWFCGPASVYVTFVFAPVEPKPPLGKPDERESLSELRLERRWEDCL